MGIIVDLSEWQGTIDFTQLKGHVDGVILRVQHGYTHPDSKYKEYVAGCKTNGIHFGTYAFFAGVSVNDAITEAKSAYSLMDASSVFFALDIETESMKDLVSGGQAFIDYLHQQGVKNVGLYSGEYFFTSHNLGNIKSDFFWIANYGVNDGQPHTKPLIPCDLWQYTSVGKVPGINTNVDLSQAISNKVFFAPPKIIYFVTGGFGGAGLGDIQSFVASKNWWYTPTRLQDGSISLTIGGFTEGSEAANEIEGYLKSHNAWYEIKC